MKLSNYIWLFLLSLSVLSTGCTNRLDNSFTLIMLPDTQNYADIRLKESNQQLDAGDLRKYFYAQTDWIKQNTDNLNIAMVAHVGDIVQTDYPQEWAIADTAFRVIDDSTPYILSLGNHDMGYETISVKPPKYKTAVTRDTQIDNYFPPSRFNHKPWYGGNFNQSSENYYCIFEEAKMKFLIISIEFVPRDNVLTWANKVIASHPNHRCIVITHWYLKEDGKRFTNNPYGVKGNNAQRIWQKFVSQHENIFMVLSGHVLGESRLTSTGINGNDVHQILADYQGLPNGGDGYLRIMKFIPDKNIIETKTFSPTQNKFIETPESQFTLEYQMQ
jgi:hypothetical protein